MIALQSVLENITNNLEQRRLEITKLRRVTLSWGGKALEGTVVSMAVPMIYAHWEGYVKEVCQLYLEYIESSVGRSRELQSDLLGYMWTPQLRRLVGGLNSERRRAVAELALNSHQAPVSFSEKEKAVETKSNLWYRVLESIAESLCLDITHLAMWSRHLDALVDLRNNIAHGARPRSLTCSDFEEHASQTLALMHAFEGVVVSALTKRTFCTV